MSFEVTKELIEELIVLIEQKDEQTILARLGDEHHADIAEVLD